MGSRRHEFTKAEMVAREDDWRRNQSSTAGFSVASLFAGAGTILVLTGLVFLISRGDDTDSVESGAPTSVDAQAEGTTTVQTADDSEDTSTTTVAPVAQGEIVVLDAILDDPLALTEAMAVAKLQLDTASGEFCYEVSMDGMDSPYDGHIHVGPAGVKGGIVIDMGALSDSPKGCITNSLIDTEAILADLSGHYIEFHDPDGVRTIRAQLARSEDLDPESAGTAAEAEEKGAVVIIETGALVLRGDVPDQVSIDKFIESFADIDLGSTQLVNELTIVPGSPRPSGRILIADSVLFDIGSDELSDVDSTVLADVATIFKARPAWTMTVVGHTDNTGAAVANLELSLRRAAAVRDVLVANGVSAEALTIKGAGDTEPFASNDTDAGRSQNRRIEFEVLPG